MNCAVATIQWRPNNQFIGSVAIHIQRCHTCTKIFERLWSLKNRISHYQLVPSFDEIKTRNFLVLNLEYDPTSRRNCLNIVEIICCVLLGDVNLSSSPQLVAHTISICGTSWRPNRVLSSFCFPIRGSIIIPKFT